VLVIWGGDFPLVGLRYQVVVDCVMDEDQEVAVVVGLDFGFLKAVDLGLLVKPVLIDLDYLGYLIPNLGQGLALVLLPDGVVLGQVFLRSLGVLGFGFLLSRVDFVVFLKRSGLGYLIRILRSLRLGQGLEVVLVLVVGLPSLLE